MNLESGRQDTKARDASQFCHQMASQQITAGRQFNHFPLCETAVLLTLPLFLSLSLQPSPAVAATTCWQFQTTEKGKHAAHRNQLTCNDVANL